VKIYNLNAPSVNVKITPAPRTRNSIRTGWSLKNFAVFAVSILPIKKLRNKVFPSAEPTGYRRGGQRTSGFLPQAVDFLIIKETDLKTSKLRDIGL